MTPNREQLEQDLLAYVEGTLPPDEHARIQIYLANTDPKFAQQIAGMLDDRLALQSLPAASAPADLAARIMDQVERQSLIGGVEKQLVHEPRRWFLNRLAIAAALFIVVGGFSFYVINMAYHRDTPLHDLVLKNTPPASANDRVVASADQSAAQKQRGDLSVGRVGGADGVGVPLRVAAAAPVISLTPAAGVDHDAELKDLVERGRLNALGNAATSRDYKAIASARDALAMLDAANRRQLTDSPMVITVVARDTQDVQRLETLLSSYTSPAPEEALKKESLQGKFATTAAPLTKPNAKAMKAITGTAPDTYHLFLKPEQLDQLSQSFVVASVARGDAAYSITGAVQPAPAETEKDKAPAGAAEAYQALAQVPHNQQPSQNSFNNQQQNDYNTNGVAANGTNSISNGVDGGMGGGRGGNATLNGNNSVVQKAGQNNKATPKNDEYAPATQAVTPAAPAAVNVPAEKPILEHSVVTDAPEAASAPAAPWIDCVITIVPSTANSSGTNGGVPQK